MTPGALSMILAVAATAPDAPIAPRTVMFDGARYRLVTGNRLRAAFVGKKIRYRDPHREGQIVLTSSIRCDGFYPDGRYVSCGDRVPRPMGRYEIRGDRVCVTISGPWRCYTLYRSAAGADLLGHPGEEPAFEPIAFVLAADETVAPGMR